MSSVNIIKLSATPSTNSYLKELAKTCVLSDGTVVITDRQTKGRGQFEAHWQSQPSNSLTFSFFKRFKSLAISKHWYVSMAVSLAVSEMLVFQKIPEITIKWPNDIMSRGKKCCGILIENSARGTRLDTSVIGIGLNVNEQSFTGLPNATSMHLSSGQMFKISEVLNMLLENIELRLLQIERQEFDAIFEAYNQNLFRLNKIAVFSTKEKESFNAIIKRVTEHGLLVLENERKQESLFNLKEIQYCF